MKNMTKNNRASSRADASKQAALPVTIKKNMLEWGMFTISMLLVVSIIVYLTHHAITHRPGKPNLRVQYQKDPSPESPYRYQVYVINSGGETVKDVKVEASVLSSGAEKEKISLDIDFAPKWSKTEGWVIFSSHVATADSVVMRVTSYKHP